MTDPRPSAATQSKKTGDPQGGLWRTVVAAAIAGVLVVALAIAGLAYAPAVIDSVSEAASSSQTLSGTAKVGAGERRVTVALADGVTDDTAVSATVTKGKGKAAKPVPARVIGPTQEEPQFTVVLGKPARKGGTAVQWKAAGLDLGGRGTSDAWSTEWVVVLSLMVISLLAALAAFWVAVRRRQSGADSQVDVGPELASFLKVTALLMIAALALIAVMLATEEKSLTGLFALLGTIAGYLAGNRSQTSIPGQSRGQGRRTAGPHDNGGGMPSDQGRVPEEAPRLTVPPPVPETRSLL